MMATQFVNVKPIVDLSELPHITETYDIQWTIPNWIDIRKNEILLKNQKIIFETGGSGGLSHIYPTKWSVGLNAVPNANSHLKYALVDWKLLEIHGNFNDKLPEAIMQTKLLSCYDVAKFIDSKTETNLVVGQTIRETKYQVEVLHSYGCTSNFDYVREDGSIKYEFKLTLKSCLNDEEFISYKMTQFMEKSIKQMCANLTSLLDERDNSSDLKIISSDQKEIFVHRAILKAQCPVFAGMLNCDLSETNTGIVNVEDVSAATMNILLNYFYTGQLLPSWRKDDNIVEFTYAAGKYQITPILELLDDILGKSVPEGDATNIDVQLLYLTSKLSRSSAEGRLLKRIVDKINSVKTSQEIFDLFGYGDEEVLEKANVLGEDKFGETQALDILDDLLGDSEQNIDEYEKRGLHLLAVVQMKNGSLKNLENCLLKMFAKIASKFSSADELFKVFGHGKLVT